jgi:hypothetical protein
MMRTFFFNTPSVLAVLVSSIVATPALANCILKSEPAKTITGCNVAVGYSNGNRVGQFRASGKVVGLTKACITDDSFHNTIGRISPPNKIIFAGTTYVLSNDCRSSSKN